MSKQPSHNRIYSVGRGASASNLLGARAHKCAAGPSRSDRVSMRPWETQAPRRVPSCPRRARKAKLIARVDHSNVLILGRIVGKRASGARQQGGKMGNNRRQGGKAGEKICPGAVCLRVSEGTNI